MGTPLHVYPTERIIPYHLGGRGLDLPRLTLRPIQYWPIAHALLEWEEKVKSASRCRWCHFFAGGACVCSVCEGGEGKMAIIALWLLFYEVGLYVGFLWCRVLLSQRWLAPDVRAVLNPVIAACHRFKRTKRTI